MIPYGRQDISGDDIDAVKLVLESDFLTQGPIGRQFEDAVAEYCGARYGVATNSATSALHLSCLALGVGPGDLVWTSPISFVASANCAVYCGASVDFVDVDESTGCMDVEQLRDKLLSASQLPKVVIPVHFGGSSCDMKVVSELAEAYGFSVIEDASHAIGGKYGDHKVGNCQFSDLCVFSFHPVKIITTGEGGLVTTNDAELASKISLLRSHGITRDKQQLEELEEGDWYYEQIALGFNYRMTDIQAALGLSQLSRLDQFVAERNRLAAIYDALIDPTVGVGIDVPGNVYSARHLYVLLVNDGSLQRKLTFDKLRASKINVNVHYIPIYRQPYYRNQGFDRGYCPGSENYYSRALSLPLFPGLGDEGVSVVIDALMEAR